MRATFLREFLGAHGLEIIVLQWEDRMELSCGYDGKYPLVRARVNGKIVPDLALHADGPRRSEHNLTA